MTRSIPLALVALLSTPAIAQQDCGTIENDLDRLACYDGRSSVMPEARADGAGPWKVRTETSPFEDTTDVYLTTVSEQPHICGSGEQRMSLTVQCKEKATSLILDFGDCRMSGDGDDGAVDWRLDSEKTRTLDMTGSSNDSLLGLWHGSRSIPEIRGMFGRETLLVRATPISEGAVIGRFDISGLLEASEPLRESCGWTAKDTTASIADPVIDLTAAELAEERRMMEALQEQMRANRLSTDEDIRAAEEQALAKAERAGQEAIARAQLEARRRAQAELERRRRELRRQQLAALNGSVSSEDAADRELSVPAQDEVPDTVDRLSSILGAAESFASRNDLTSADGDSASNRLTHSEAQAVLDQLRACWRVDTFSPNARNLVVTVRAEIRQNGFVNQATIQVVSPRPTPPEYRIAVERAVAALQDRRCQPFALPPQRYSAWRHMTIRFDPAQMSLE